MGEHRGQVGLGEAAVDGGVAEGPVEREELDFGGVLGDRLPVEGTGRCEWGVRLVQAGAAGSGRQVPGDSTGPAAVT
jgi:hypothetical protein